MNKPKFPVKVYFHEDGDVWELDNTDELASNLEWFDSLDPNQNATVIDAEGRKVVVKVEKLELIIFKLQN